MQLDLTLTGTVDRITTGSRCFRKGVPAEKPKKAMESLTNSSGETADSRNRNKKMHV